MMEEVSLPSRSNLIMPALTHVTNTKLPRTRQLISSKFWINRLPFVGLVVPVVDRMVLQCRTEFSARRR